MTQHDWNDIADKLINTDWHTKDDTCLNSTDLIKKSTDTRLQTILLRDIAKSLRILRCVNFQGIPYTLTEISKNTKKIKRKKK